MKCDVCCADKATDDTVRLRIGLRVLCDRCAKAYDCRWFDRMCVACRNPSRLDGIPNSSFIELRCSPYDGCGYEKEDERHPAWDSEDDIETRIEND